MIKRKILITGGTGFIGSSLAIELVKNNYEIILYDINEENDFYKSYENISYIYGDTNDIGKLENIFEHHNIAGIIHLAAVSRVVVAENNQEECIRTNVLGTKTLLKAISNILIEKKPWLIFGSSREVYGEPKTLPVLETFEKKYVNIYGDSKIQGENMFIDFAKKYNISVIILRFANVYGNEFDLLDRVLPRFINAISVGDSLIIEGGNQIIDFTHIDDTVDTIIKAITYINISKNVIDDFHILPGIGWTLYEAISYIEKHLNKKAKIKVNPKRDYDVEKFIGNPLKIKEVLKSRNFMTLDEGLKISIPKYLKALK